KTAAGATGGLIGGIIGGALYDPVLHFTQDNHENHIARLVAICVIGLIAGLGTGLIENAVKTGWLKVSAGLIAGKQFILYRDPTFIGSALSCHIYLFRDPAVGKRHAAVHIVPGGFEIENLPLGSGTLVNQEQIVGRRRLRNGDLIQIGSTVMTFQEKKKAA
ncbi:MAG: FHA domain-containing protein, partial [Phycisphaerae bacterium]|nr:FHA domain-containing protein [Phycisphaerae bacterium]